MGDHAPAAAPLVYRPTARAHLPTIPSSRLTSSSGLGLHTNSDVTSSALGPGLPEPATSLVPANGAAPAAPIHAAPHLGEGAGRGGHTRHPHAARGMSVSDKTPMVKRATSIAHVVRRHNTIALGRAGSVFMMSDGHSPKAGPPVEVKEKACCEPVRAACPTLFAHHELVCWPLVLAVVGVLLAVAAYLLTHGLLMKLSEDDFEAELQHRAAALQHLTAGYDSSASVVAATMLAATGGPSHMYNCTGACQSHFNAVAAALFAQHTGLLGLQWAPAVAAGSSQETLVQSAAVVNGYARTDLSGVAAASAGLCSPSFATYEGGLPPAPALAAEPMSAGTLRTPTTLAAANTPALAPPAWQMFDWSSCAVTQAAVVSARDCGGAAAALVPWTIDGSPAGPQDAGRAVAVLHPVYLTGDVPSTLTDRRAQFAGVGIAISSLQEWRRAGGSGPDNTRGRQGAELQVRLTTAGNPGTGTVATSSPGFGRSGADFGASTQFGLFSPSPDETECALAAAAPGVGDSFTVFLESSDDFTSERLVDATALLAMGLILLLALVVAVAYGTRHWHARKRLHIAIGQHELGDEESRDPASKSSTSGSASRNGLARTRTQSTNNVKVATRMDGVIHLIRQVQGVVPTYAAQQLARALQTLQHPDLWTASHRVDASRAVERSHGWADQGLLSQAVHPRSRGLTNESVGASHHAGTTRMASGFLVTAGAASGAGAGAGGHASEPLPGTVEGTAEPPVPEGPRPVYHWMPSLPADHLAPGGGDTTPSDDSRRRRGVGREVAGHVAAVAPFARASQSRHSYATMSTLDTLPRLLSYSATVSARDLLQQNRNGDDAPSGDDANRRPRRVSSGTVTDGGAGAGTDRTPSRSKSSRGDDASSSLGVGATAVDVALDDGDADLSATAGMRPLRNPQDVALRLETAGMSVPRLLAECTGVMDMLEDLDSYETVDMLQVAEHTPRSLVAVLVRVLGDIEVLEALGLEEGANIRFAALINDGYSRQAAYHNHAHAANCVWAIQHWLRNTPAMYSLTPLQFYAALMAAAIHDFRHPGFNNKFLVATSHPIAIAHNDDSVLERFHVAEAFKVAMDMGAMGPFNGLTVSQHESMRALIIAMVLATDVSTHYDFLAKHCKGENRLVVQDDMMDVHGPNLTTRALRLSMTDALKAMIMLADIGHASASFEVHKRWSVAIREEFFLQGDEEFAFGMEVSPLCDRRTAEPLAVSQSGFFDFVAMPLFKGMVPLFGDSVTRHVERLRANKARWASKDSPTQVSPNPHATHDEHKHDATATRRNHHNGPGWSKQDGDGGGGFARGAEPVSVPLPTIPQADRSCDSTASLGVGGSFRGLSGVHGGSGSKYGVEGGGANSPGYPVGLVSPGASLGSSSVAGSTTADAGKPPRPMLADLHFSSERTQAPVTLSLRRVLTRDSTLSHDDVAHTDTVEGPPHTPSSREVVHNSLLTMVNNSDATVATPTPTARGGDGSV